MRILLALALVVLLAGCVFKIGEITFYKTVVVKPAIEQPKPEEAR